MVVIQSYKNSVGGIMKEMYENCKFRFKGNSCEDCPLMCNGKEIIIDDVNVAECEHHLSTGYCQLQMIFQGMILKLPFGKHLECNLCDKDCYFKQLQRLKQENKELKKKINTYVCSTNCHKYIQADKYKQALKEIREIIKTLIVEMPEYHDCYYKDECGDNCTPKQQGKVTYCCFENVEKIEKLINEALDEQF